jgi:hypothetical protein
MDGCRAWGVPDYPFELVSHARLFFSRSLCSVTPTVRTGFRDRSSLAMRPSRIVSFSEAFAERRGAGLPKSRFRSLRHMMLLLLIPIVASPEAPGREYLYTAAGSTAGGKSGAIEASINDKPQSPASVTKA